MHKKLESAFDMSALVQSIINKYNEIVENTVFELMTVTRSSTMATMKEKGFEIERQVVVGTSETRIILWHSFGSSGKEHIMSYKIYYDIEESKIKRDRLVNGLEEEIE